ncbi:MAG: prepilin-type N-terminal cleavage/methylation domain-containing protein [Deltaproteobacteria bacterium]|nr:prepilin-type N-terminal cleavage/methylation domain-containing protein [Deltaproteobacteria bacterium]
MSNQEGFTLIELLITLVVLSFGLLGLAGLQAQMIRSNAFSSNMTIATSIGADLIEEARSKSLATLFASLTDLNNGNPFTTNELFLTKNNQSTTSIPYGDINGDGNLDPGDIDIDGDGKVDNPYKGFTWTRVVTFYPDPTRPLFAKVAVSVFWPDPGRTEPPKLHHADFTTIIGRM